MIRRLGGGKTTPAPKKKAPRPSQRKPPDIAYGDAWSRVEDVVERVLASGETELSRVLRLVEAEVRSMDTTPVDGTAYGITVRLPRAALWAARQALRMRVLVTAARPDTRLVLELGAGWGTNLLDLHLAGGPLVPYYALELTESGRRVAERLARLEPDLELTAKPFDLRAAAYDVPRVEGHALVLTSHAIEQIKELPEETITGLFDLAPSLTVVHFEPIGWQVRPGAATGASQEYSTRNDYNQNLWPLLQRLEAARELTIDVVEPDILHHKVRNASTLVVWRRG